LGGTAKHPDLKPHVAQLQFLMQVDLLASGHVPLIALLMKMPGVKSMRDLALLDESAWHGLAAKSGAPPHIAGATPQAREQFLVASILATIQAAFPTLTVWRIAAHTQHVDPLAAKFIENSPDLDICTTRVDVFAEQHAATAWKGIPDAKKAAVLKEVKRLQRLFAVSVNADTFRALLGTGLGSAHEIAVVPQGAFEGRYGAALGGAGPALQIHQRAQFINARALHLRTSVNDALHTPATRGLGHQAPTIRRAPGGGPQGSLKEDLVKRFPNAEELFGSMSLCNCEECESAIGPAAYFVDVLDFLGHCKHNSQGVTPLDALIGNAAKKVAGRRPDLAHLNLTCANTNTAMPYIDIVNEILESYVALGSKLDKTSAHDSANSTSSELMANPQFIDQHAYRILDSEYYPFTLPFNRPLLVPRSSLNQLGASRHAI